MADPTTTFTLPGYRITTMWVDEIPPSRMDIVNVKGVAHGPDAAWESIRARVMEREICYSRNPVDDLLYECTLERC